MATIGHERLDTLIVVGILTWSLYTLSVVLLYSFNYRYAAIVEIRFSYAVEFVYSINYGYALVMMFHMPLLEGFVYSVNYR